MAITNYDELKIAVAKWLNRDDLTDRIPEFITIGEAKINRKLRTIDQYKALDVVIDNEFLPVPADWIQTANISHDTDEGGEIRYITPQRYVQARPSFSPSGKPRYYTLEDRSLRFLPVPDGPYPAIHSYYMRVPALSDTMTTNWLLTGHPDVYLASALLAANTYLRDMEGVTLATAELADVLASMQQADQGDKVSTTPLMRAQAI